MKNLRWTVIGCGLLLALRGLCGPIEEATYSELFGRAQGLLPGVTTVDLDLDKAGGWEIVGGRRVDAAGGLAIEAGKDSVECVWKGFFPCDLPNLSMVLSATCEIPVSADMQLYGLYRDRFSRQGKPQEIPAGEARSLSFRLRRLEFQGFKLVVEGDQLAGHTIALQDPKLQATFRRGYFRREVELPAGEIWEAVAEVGNLTTLYVNGERVDDESIIVPRSTATNDYTYAYAAAIMYQSKRVPLKPYLKPGKNVLGMYVVRSSWWTAGYLRGSVIMASGERVMLDSDAANWTWSPEASPGWASAGFDASGWQPILDSATATPDPEEARTIAIRRFGFSSRPKGDMPCYDGFIKLRNPADNKLFFMQERPVIIDVSIPMGFRGRDPELQWEIGRYAAGGAFTQVAAGKTGEFERRDPSLQAAITAPRLPRGVYVLTSRLVVGGQALEERVPEPMVVTGKVTMPESAGDRLDQGMDLSLEKTIDFTDPDDPHPWFETDRRGPEQHGTMTWGPELYHTVEPALIVETNGLKYRVTRPVNQAQFSYRVNFAHPGDWYLLVLEYPDDAERWIGVSCNAWSRTPAPKRRQEPEHRCGGCSKCGPAVWTGGKYPNTGKMLEMKWLYRPDPGSHAVNVMSLMKKTAAAAARLRIYHVTGRLPELNAGGVPLDNQRRFGMLTERTAPWQSGIYNLFSSFAELPFWTPGTGAGGADHNNPLHEACEQLRLMEDAASHYAEYMRFAGHNLHTMGCYQYNDKNTAPQYVTGSSRIQYNPQGMLGRVLQANDLQFYASVEFVSTVKRFSPKLWAYKRPDRDWFLVSREGASGPVGMSGTGWGGFNFLHPDIEGDMLTVARQLAECFKHQPNFLGINWTAYFGGSWLPSYRSGNSAPLDFGYGDFTIGLFEHETGVEVPGAPGDEQRFAKRYAFLTSDAMKSRWLEWRSGKMAEFFVKVRDEIHAIRPDLEVVASCYTSFPHIMEWQEQDISFKEYLTGWGWGPDAFKNKPNVWLMPWLHLNARYQPAVRRMGYAMAWEGNHDAGFYRPFNDLERRALMLCAGWIEVEAVAQNYPYREGWPRPYQQTMMGQPREEMAMEPYVQALIGCDPQMVMIGFTDVSPYIGVEDVQRKFTRVLRRLPQGKFGRVLDTGFDTNFAIRALRRDNACDFYVVNPGYWPITGRVTVQGAAKVTDMVSGREQPLREAAIEVNLAPFGLAAFTAVGQEPRVIAWKTDPVSDQELRHMRNIIDKAEAAARKPDMEGFLGREDFAILTGTTAMAEQAISEQRYAAAWRALTDADFWTVLFQKAPEIEFADMVKPRAMTAVNLGSGLAPALDGVLDDRIWGERFCKPVGNFVTMDKTYAEVRTVVRMARSRNRLFIAFECHDPEPDKIRGTADKKDEKKIWGARDDLVDIFIMPDAENYYQFAVSANGATFDQRCSIHGRRDYDYAPKWQAATARHEWGWAAEIEIDALEAFGVPIAKGAEWKINFHRAFRLGQQPHSSWVYSPSWHSMEHMGKVRFVELGK